MDGSDLADLISDRITRSIVSRTMFINPLFLSSTSTSLLSHLSELSLWSRGSTWRCFHLSSWSVLLVFMIYRGL